MASIQRLVLVHEQFIEPEDLWARFVDYFKKSASNQVVQFRVINIIKKWIEVNYDSFTERPSMSQLLNQFMDELLQTSPQLNGYLSKTLAVRIFLTIYDYSPQNKPNTSVPVDGAGRST